MNNRSGRLSAKKKQEQAAGRVVLVSLLTNISDIVLNLVVGLMTGSVSVLAQSLQGMADMMTGGTLVLGVERSKKHANEKYPFGYGREIFFWVLISALFMLIITGGVSIYLGISRIINPQPLESGWLALSVLTIGLILNGYAFSLSYRQLKKHDLSASIMQGIKNSSLIEMKATFLIDGAGALAAAFGLIAIIMYTLTGIAVFDGLGSLAIGLLMSTFSIILIRDVKDFLVGKAASQRIQDKIAQVAISVDGVQEVLDLRTMFLGSARLLVIIELHIDERLKTKSIELLSDEVKKRILRKVPRVEIVQVEVETPDYEVQ